jgi:hypothetical protein
MTPQKTITITVLRDGQPVEVEVLMRYCSAAECHFEEIAEREIGIFIPTFGKDDKGNDIVNSPAKAKTKDYLVLAYCAILAAYSRAEKEPPVTLADILYDISPKDELALITNVSKLRMEWYSVPGMVGNDEPQNDEGEGGEKND